MKGYFVKKKYDRNIACTQLDISTAYRKVLFDSNKQSTVYANFP